MDTTAGVLINYILLMMVEWVLEKRNLKVCLDTF